MESHEDFSIREAREQEAVVLELRGDLDLASADDVTARLKAHRDAGEPVILDLDG